MASNDRRPRMDVETMYPNFHAEQHKHHVQEKSSMSVPRKSRSGSSVSRRESLSSQGTRPPLRNGLQQLGKRMDYQHKGDTLSAEHLWVPPIAPNRSSNQQDAIPLAQRDTGEVVEQGSARPPSRQVAIRGQLNLASPAAWEDNHVTSGTVGISPRLRPLPFAPNISSSTASLLQATARTLSMAEAESLQELVLNSRPRTRYARRELYRQGSAPSLERISTAPTTSQDNMATPRDTSLLTSSRSMGILQTAKTTARSTCRPTSRQAFQSGVIEAIEAVFPGAEMEDTQDDDDDDTNVFLTELEAAARAASAAAAAKLAAVARHIALGSFLLYGNPPGLVAAIQHFTAALKIVEIAQSDDESPNHLNKPSLVLTSLLNHHRGIALREVVVASKAVNSKAAQECTKYAFAAQRRALELAQRVNDTRLQARAVKALGLLLLDAHSHGPALKHQQEALQYALEEKDRELEARVYANLGNLALAQLQFGHALSCHQRDLDLCSFKNLDCRLGRARAHRNLSIVFAKLHRREQQVKHEQEARTVEHKDGGAYLNDVATHVGDSVGNICHQSSTPIDPKLVDLVTQDLQEIVRGLSSLRKHGLAGETDSNNSIAAALGLEWNTTEIDIEEALAAVEGKTPSAKHAREAVLTSPAKAAPAAAMTAPPGVARVSIRINNYSPATAPERPESYNHKA